jgi:hypothetical protein
MGHSKLIMRRNPQFTPNSTIHKNGYAFIKLTYGKWAIMDEIDYPLVKDFRWFTKHSHGNYYALANPPRRLGIGKIIRMHRLIMGLSSNLQIDHRNRQGLDNRRSNLRLATHAQNQRNGKRPKTNTSGYKGVNWHKLSQKWRACISINNKQKHLGLFNSLSEAIIAYDKAAKKHHGQFANINGGIRNI